MGNVLDLTEGPDPWPEPNPGSHDHSSHGISAGTDLDFPGASGGNGSSLSEPIAEPEDSILSDYETILWSTLYMLLITSTLILNGFIVGAMLKRGSDSITGNHNEDTNCNRKPSDLFLLSLIVARMNVAVFVMPARIMGMFSTEGIGSLVCKACAFAGTGSATTSVLCTCAVAVCKVVELKYSGRPSRINTLYVIGLLWIIGHLYAARDLFLYDIVEKDNLNVEIKVCATIHNYSIVTAVFMFSDMLLLFLIPSFIVTYATYILITRTKRPSRIVTIQNQMTFQKSNGYVPDINRNISSNCHHLTIQRHSVNSKQIETPSKIRDTQFMALIILLLFMFCQAAIPIWNMMFLTDSISHLTINAVFNIGQSLYLWNFLNPLLNALTYLYFRLDIRDRFRSIFIVAKSDNKKAVLERII